MAINLLCPQCRSTYRTGTRSCTKCSLPLSTYKVRVKLPSGRTLCKQTGNLRQARSIETKFKAMVIDRTVLGIINVPTVSQAFDRLMAHARVYKRTWKSDLGRWNLYLRDALGSLRMDLVTPGISKRFSVG